MSASTLSGTRTSAASFLATHRSPRRSTKPSSISMRTTSSTKSGLPSARSSTRWRSCGGQVVDRQQRAEQRARFLLGEWLEVDAARLHAARSPGRPVSSSSGRDEQTTSSGASRVQVTRYSIRSSSGRLGPVDVLEDEHERPARGDHVFDQAAESPRDLLVAAFDGAVRGVGGADDPGEAVGDVGVRADARRVGRVIPRPSRRRRCRPARARISAIGQ